MIKELKKVLTTVEPDNQGGISGRQRTKKMFSQLSSQQDGELDLHEFERLLSDMKIFQSGNVSKHLSAMRLFHEISGLAVRHVDMLWNK